MYKLFPLIVSVIAIIAAIGSVFTTFAITKQQIAELQKQIIDIKTDIRVIQAQAETKELVKTVQQVQIMLARVDAVLQGREIRLASIEEALKVMQKNKNREFEIR